MVDLSFREPQENDWLEILSLANTALRELQNPPSQCDWLTNRRAFSSQGTQHHFVAVAEGAIIGYAAAERHANAPQGEYRLFVVVAPSDRTRIGTVMLRALRHYLIGVRAHSVRMVEYANDSGFLAYLREIGFGSEKAFALVDRTPVVELKMQAPFEALA